MNNRLMVVFPGANYGPDCPLLYYAALVFEAHGYEAVAVDYGDIVRRAASLDEALGALREQVGVQLKAMDLEKYSEVVFVSKSLGTVVALWAAETLDIAARHVVLTPISRTLPLIRANAGIEAVAAATRDKALDAEILRAHCASAGVRLLQVEGADHSMETPGDVDASLGTLKTLTALYADVCTAEP